MQTDDVTDVTDDDTQDEIDALGSLKAETASAADAYAESIQAFMEARDDAKESGMSFHQHQHTRAARMLDACRGHLAARLEDLRERAGHVVPIKRGNVVYTLNPGARSPVDRVIEADLDLVVDLDG